MLVKTSSRELWIDVEGSGPPLVMLPGGPGLASDYLEQLSSSLRRGHTVVRVDPPGCGRSPHDAPHDLERLFAALESLRYSLGFERWRVVGHSFGGDLALAYALLSPETVVDVRAVSPTGVQNDRDWHRAYRKSVGADEPPMTDYAVDPRVAEAMLASWREWIKRPELLREIAALPQRYVAIIGSEDVRPSWPVAQVAALVPNGELVVIDGAGHQPWLTQSAALSSALGQTRQRRKAR